MYTIFWLKNSCEETSLYIVNKDAIMVGEYGPL